MNYISPINHPESYLSGSTIASMVSKTKKLDLEYFAVTDNGRMSAVLKAYSYAKENKVKLIAGVELFFKDSNCPIISGTPSDNIKYFKLAIHFKDQEAYQKMVEMVSDQSREQVRVGEELYPLFNWKDLEEISKFNVTACSANVEDMVTKHLLVNRPDLSIKYYEKLKGLFDFYPTILPFNQDRHWSSLVELKLESGEVVHIPSEDRVEFEEAIPSKKKSEGVKWKKMSYKQKAINLVNFASNKKKLTYVYINKMKHKVLETHQGIISAKLINRWELYPDGDIQTKANKFMLALARRYGDLDKVLINNYAYYADKEDKIVQDMRLGEEKRVGQLQHMASLEEVNEYLTNYLELPDSSISDMVNNSHKWAKNFNSFELKYDYSLPKIDGNPKEILIDTIKKNGRMKWDNPKYVRQFKEELALLTENGKVDLIPYFLPIVDIYNFYKDNGHLTGPARGSAGGFLISYLLGITHIDPIKYNLSSARFLTLDRVQQGNLPDIDCFHGDTDILTENGYMTIENLSNLPKNKYPNLISYDGVNFNKQRPVAIFKKGNKEVFEFILDNGRAIKCTEDHLVLTKKGWLEIGECCGKDIEIIDFN